MTIELNHTIVPARDPKASAQFLAGVLGLEVDPPAAHFTPVTLTNRVTLDYDQAQRLRLAPLRVPGLRGGVRRRLRPHPAERYHLLRRPGMSAGGPDLPQQGRPPRRLLPRPERPPHKDPHPGRLSLLPIRPRPTYLRATPAQTEKVSGTSTAGRHCWT